ncbi:MAG: sigma-54 dependent transcriptional regulator [Myxococcales bacterium]|nr:sigma-54 dependent transcriptional regulator [Myxococcales bacterium]
MPPPTLLIVDDDLSNLQSLERVFQRGEAITGDLRVLTASDGKEALDLLRKQRVDVLLCDLMMPGVSGLDLLKAAQTLSPETVVVLMTAYGTVETAVEAMKDGAYDFITKPLKRAHVLRVVGKALERQSLVQENRALRSQLDAEKRRSIVGQSLAMRRTMEIIAQAAASHATVLLLGESGTGKELLARHLHDSSPRAGRPFVPVNCAAIPEAILEAELFGYERGAFTGAVQRREGRFAQADSGTLFLDEIGEVPLHLQVKLLRALQEGEIEPLGGRMRRVDIRLVAATNKDLRRAVSQGRFREDLFYRLNVISVTVPPLRDRLDDVPLLANHFLGRFCTKHGKQVSAISPQAMQALTRYSWPGNVRELENAIERAVVLCRHDVIEVGDLPREVRGGEVPQTSETSLRFEIGTPLSEIELRVIQETLKHTRGDKRLAAQLLGIATRTIYRRLAEVSDEPDAPDEEAKG